MIEVKRQTFVYRFWPQDEGRLTQKCKMHEVNNLNPQKQCMDWVIKSKTNAYGGKQCNCESILKHHGFLFHVYGEKPQWNLPLLHETKAFFLKLGTTGTPKVKTNVLVRSVPFLTTRWVIATFALFECTPVKPKPMSVSFALNVPIHTPLLWVQTVHLVYFDNALSFSKIYMPPERQIEKVI